MTIRTGAPNALYDEGWERCFGKGKAKAAEAEHLAALDPAMTVAFVCWKCRAPLTSERGADGYSCVECRPAAGTAP